jgi:hypothetical protein
MPAKKTKAAPRSSAPATKEKAAAKAPAAKATKPGKRAAATKRDPTHDEIADRAYALFRERGGNAFENWIEAERLLRAGK